MDEVVHCDRLALISEGNILTTDTPQGLLQRGHAEVRVWRAGKMDTHSLQDYPADLPKALQSYGLEKNIDRIELETNTLERIVLGMIEKGGKQ